MESIKAHSGLLEQKFIKITLRYTCLLEIQPHLSLQRELDFSGSQLSFLELV